MVMLKELLDVLHESVDLSTDKELAWAVRLIVRVQTMNSGERDTICGVYLDGPLFDGDVPSKAARDSLVNEGMISRIVVKGEEGFNACTYLGSCAYRLIDAGA